MYGLSEIKKANRLADARARHQALEREAANATPGEADAVARELAQAAREMVSHEAVALPVITPTCEDDAGCAGT